MNIYYDKVILGKGQTHCESCLGTGFIQKRFTFNYGGLDETGMRNIKCKSCKATGKFDWIETIVGKKINDDKI